MLPSASEYAIRTRDVTWERELAQNLRASSEVDRLKFIQDFSMFNTVVALDLAKKCLKEKKSFEILLNQGLDEANSSGLRYWLECVVPRLGFRRVVSILRELAHTKNKPVAQAAYWLPIFSDQPGFSQELVESLRSL